MTIRPADQFVANPGGRGVAGLYCMGCGTGIEFERITPYEQGNGPGVRTMLAKAAGCKLVPPWGWLCRDCIGSLLWVETGARVVVHEHNTQPWEKGTEDAGE